MHKEHINEYKKLHYETNKQSILERQKQQYETKKQSITEQRKLEQLYLNELTYYIL